MTQRAFYQTEYPYFVTTDINRRLPLFDDSKLANILKNNIFYYKETLDFILYAYVVMPDHLHMVIKVNEQYNISKVMQAIKYHAAKDVHNYLESEGKIWKPRFNYRTINDKKGLKNILNYIQNNPVNSKLESKFSKMPYMYFNQQEINKIA